MRVSKGRSSGIVAGMVRGLVGGAAMLVAGNAAAVTGYTGPAAISSPRCGKSFDSTTPTISWPDVGGAAYRLTIGGTQGGSQWFDSRNLTGTSVTITPGLDRNSDGKPDDIALPADGRTLFVRLRTKNPDTQAWQTVDCQVTAVRPDFVAPSPTCGSTLTGTTETLTWSANGNAKAQSFRVKAGFSLGGKEFGDSGWTTATSKTFENIPGDGSLVFVRLQWKKSDGTASFFRDCKMVAPTFAPPAFVAPGPVCGGTVDVPSPTFQWDPGPWQIEKYGLQIGSTPGGSDYFNNSDLGTATSATVTTPIPSDGRLVYVRLRYMPNAIKRWLTQDCVATAGAPQRPILTGPACGSSLPGSQTNFSWDPRGVAVEKWQLLAGSTLGGKEYFESAVLDGPEDGVLATGIPRDGRALFARLRWREGGVWKASDCTYTAYKAMNLRSEGSAERTSSLTCTPTNTADGKPMPLRSSVGCANSSCEPPFPTPVPPVPGNLTFPTLGLSTRGSPDGDPNAFGGSWSLSGNFVSQCDGKLRNESLNTGSFAVQQDEAGQLSGKVTTIVVPSLLGCTYSCASPGNCTLSCPDAKNLKCAVTCTPKTDFCDRDSTVSGSVAGDGSISMSLTHNQVIDYDCGSFGKLHIEDRQGQVDDPATPAVEPTLPGLELDFPAPERVVN